MLVGGGAHDVAEAFEARYRQRFYPVAEWILNACVFVGESGTAARRWVFSLVAGAAVRYNRKRGRARPAS